MEYINPITNMIVQIPISEEIKLRENIIGGSPVIDATLRDVAQHVKFGESASAPKSNVFIGLDSGMNNKGKCNTFLGSYTGRDNTGGDCNTFLGYYAGRDNTNGWCNTFLGYYAGSNSTDGQANTFLGSFAGQDNKSGSYNTSLGYYAGNNNTDGQCNTFLGYCAGSHTTCGGYNTFLGTYAGAYETGSNAFYINNIDQTNTAGDKAYSLMYGTFAGAAGTLVGQTLTTNVDKFTVGPAANGCIAMRTTGSVADSGTYVLSDNEVRYGIMIVYQQTSGNAAIYGINSTAADPVEISDPYNDFSVTEDNANTTNIYRDGANGNKLTLQNKEGSARNYTILLIGV